jgi:outer membrane protein
MHFARSKPSAPLWQALFLACIAAAITFPNAANALTLEEALTYVYQENPNLEGQRKVTMRADEEVSKALAGWRPRLNAEFQKTESTLKQRYDSGVQSENRAAPESIALRLSQPIYTGGKTIAATKEAEANVQSERAKLKNAEQAVFLDTVRAFIGVLTGEEILELNDNNVKILRDFVGATEERWHKGDATRTDVALAESRLSRAIADRARVLSQVRSVRSSFQSVVGLPPDDLLMPGLPQNVPNDLTILQELARKNNPSRLVSAFDEKAAAANIDFARGELLPQIDLKLAVGRDFDTMQGEEQRDEFAATVVLNVPLYGGGAEYARIRQSKVALEQRKVATMVSARQLDDEIVAGWAEYDMLMSQIPLYGTQIDSAQLALDGARKELAMGFRTVLDVLTAEQDLLNARVNMSQAMGELITAAYRLLSFAGSLTAEDLRLPVKTYRPENHYDAVRGSWFGLDVD